MKDPRMPDEKLEYWKSVFTAALVAYISTRKSMSGIEAANLAAICADHAVVHMDDRFTPELREAL